MTKRITGCLLTLLLCFGLFGIPVLADPEATPGEATVIGQGQNDLTQPSGTNGQSQIDQTQQPGTNGQNQINQTQQPGTNGESQNNQTQQPGTNGQGQIDQTQQPGTTGQSQNNQTLQPGTNDQPLNPMQGTGTPGNDLVTNGTDNFQTLDTPKISLKSGSSLPILKLGPKEGDKITGISINNNNAGKISGKVTLEGDTGVDVELWKGKMIKEQPVYEPSGTFSFTGLEDGNYELKLRFLGQSTYEATYSVPVNKNKSADPISATAVGGVSKITATVTSASAKDITVTVLKGTKPIETRTITSGVGSVEIKDIPNGTYTVQFEYKASGTGVDPLKIDNVIVTDTSTAIKFTSVVAGEEKLTVSGQAAAGAPVIVSLTPGGYDTTVTPGTDGLFSAVIPCAAGTYTAVHAQYQGNPGSKVDMAGSWTVTGSSVKPELSIDPVFDDELIVMASTRPGVTVRLDVYEYSQTLVSSADGTLKFTLYHTYAAGTNLSFTVYYGNLNQYSYTTTKTVTAASVYRTLTIGDSGTDVYDLTKRLFGLDYPISAQNVYDAGVANVVQLFQQRNGLPANGIADPTTQKVAFSSSAIPYDSHYIVPLVRGDRGPLVSTLQSRLKELGYYTIRVDGIFGSGTQRAVRNFQARNGLSVTGIADVTTQNVLYSSSAIPSGGSVPSTYTTLKRSSRYQAGVVPLQSRLNALGYAAGSADGYFGSRTYRAVRNFQARNGLSVTGIADPTTQQVLYSSSAIPAGGSSVVPVPSGNVYRLLYWGCKGDDVRRLQQALKNLGYSQIKYVDGIYGKQTYDAVRAFQKNNGLSVDGIAGRKTQNRLYGTNY